MAPHDSPRAVVLGGGGFIGSNLVRSLLSSGRKVRVLELPHRDRPRLIPEHPNLDWQEGHLGNAHDLFLALGGAEAVFHLVSTTQPQSSNDNVAFDVQSNLAGTIGLLDQMRAMPDVPLVFVSSGGTVYGRPQKVPIPETHPTEPQCSYGIVKLTIEKYLALYGQTDGLNYRVLRMANPYGPGQEENQTQGVIGAFLSRILRGQRLEVWGDGSAVRDYLYIGDAVVALELAERYRGKERIFNIGSGSGRSVLEIIAAIERVTGEKAATSFTAKRLLDVPVSVLDIKRAEKELGWCPQTKLEDGLRTTLAWMRGAGV